jgi:hypothetical protein
MAQKPKLSPEYQRIDRWIESRIGALDSTDPNTKTKLANLLGQEKGKYPNARGKLTFTRSGNDTIITGETIQFKNRLRSLGCKWDGKAKRWVAKNKQITENDIENPSELAGLRKYIETMPYRTKLGNQGSP